MEADEKKTRPKSLWSHLYQQVEEQSDLCDVTIQVQTWKRKYHWCVLSASPFFAKLYESNLQERQIGLIKLNTGTPNAVQAAIHFLYGQRAKIDLDDAGDILEVAEFLMMTELKALSINKLKTIKVDLDNCLKILVLTSRYDFYLGNVDGFMMSHMSELLLNEDMVFLDKESVHFILTDKMLSYVKQEDYFRFLIKWISYCPSRSSDFPALFSCLDKDDLSAELLNNVSLDCLEETDKSLCCNMSDGLNRQRNVLIVYPPIYLSSEKQRLFVYDFMGKSWSQIVLKCKFYWRGETRAMMQDQNVIAHLKDDGRAVVFSNLLTQDEHEKNIGIHDSEDSHWFDYFAVAGKKLYCVKHFTYNKEGTNNLEENKIGLAFLDNPDILYLLSAGSQFRPRGQSKSASSLFVSEQEDDNTITVKPLLSVCGFVQSFCVADGILYLLIPKTETLILYAEEHGHVITLDLSIFTLSEKTLICPGHKGGAYVVTRSHILQIDIRKQDLDSNITASVSELLLPTEDKTLHYWSRRSLPLYEVLDDLVITVTRCKDADKIQLFYQKLPDNVSFLDKEEKFEIDVPEHLPLTDSINFLQTTLSKEFLKCPIDCPHCKENDTTIVKYYDATVEYDSDEYEHHYYDDSDGPYRPNTYFYDSCDDIYGF